MVSTTDDNSIMAGAIASQGGQGASPGVVIFTVKGKLCYVNGEAMEILRAVSDGMVEDESRLTEEAVLALCADAAGPDGAEGAKPARHLDFNGQRYAMRSVKLFKSGRQKRASHTMLIIEKSAPPVSMAFDEEKAKKAYNLTGRELDIVREVLKGATNQEIAGRLCISEYTVKDYVKKILQKMNVGNRSSIFGKIFS